MKVRPFPDDVMYTVNGGWSFSGVPSKSFTATFESPIKTEDGSMRNRSREGTVYLYKSVDPYLFELGIPVQPIECSYDVDIRQKIPLSQERDMVSDKFLQDIYAEVLNSVIDELSEDNVADTWVRIAVSDSRCKDEVVAKVKEKRFGPKAVLWSTDTEANERAIAQGYQIIHPRTLSEEERSRFESIGLSHSSEVFGSTPAIADEVTPTAGMLKVAEFAKSLARELLGRGIGVRFYSLKRDPAGATWNGSLAFNVHTLTPSWFERGITEDVIGTIVHEFGHEGNSDPDYSHGLVYQNRLNRLIGKLAFVAIKKPEMFR